MTIITPEERAAFRAAYMGTLAVALVRSDTLYWYSATDEERAEVRSTLSAHVVFPTEQQLILRECQRVEAEAKAAAKQLLQAARRDKAAAKKKTEAPKFDE